VWATTVDAQAAGGHLVRVAGQQQVGAGLNAELTSHPELGKVIP
jgi:hypothetical protein